jgi:small GTP-binding protein
MHSNSIKSSQGYDNSHFDNSTLFFYNHAAGIIPFLGKAVMKEYTTEFIRNIALVSHGSAGKTLLAESFLHLTGATTRLGKIEEGTTISDYDEEEIRRKISIYTTVLPVEYRDQKINVLDAPGFTDFVGEVISALSVADGAVVLVDSVSGVEVGTEVAWRYVDEFNSPAVGWHFDVGNIINYGWPEQWIRILGPRIQKFHIKEYSRKKRDAEGLWKGFDVKLLEGDNDWPAVMKAVDDIGYHNWAKIGRAHV